MTAASFGKEENAKEQRHRRVPLGGKGMSLAVITLLGVLATMSALPPSCLSQTGSSHSMCDHFYRILTRLPHSEIHINSGVIGDGNKQETLNTCEVIFVSDDSLMQNGVESLPSFRAEQGSELYNAGWRENDSYAADGAGTGAYGILRGNVLCLIQWEQHSWVDDSGAIGHSNMVRLTAQCHDRLMP